MNSTAAASGTESRKRWKALPSRRLIQHLVPWVIALAAGNALLLALMVDLSSHIRGVSFTENFENSALVGWEHSPGVKIINGVLRMEPGNGAFIGCCWGNISLTVRARRLGNGFLSVGYRNGDMGGYGVHFGDTGVSLTRFYRGNSVELASVPVDVPAGVWVTIQVTAIGDFHSVSLDGKTILTARDFNPFPPGGIGLTNDGTEGATGEFDDLAVLGDSDLEVAPPPSPGTEEPFHGQ